MAYAFNNDKSKHDIQDLYDWTKAHDKYFGTTFATDGIVTTADIYANRIYLKNASAIYGRLTTGTANYQMLSMSTSNNIIVGAGTNYAGYANVNIYAGTGNVQMLTKNGTLVWDGSSLRPSANNSKSLGTSSYRWNEVTAGTINADRVYTNHIQVKTDGTIAVSAIKTKQIDVTSNPLNIFGQVYIASSVETGSKITTGGSITANGTVQGTQIISAASRIKCIPSYDNTTTSSANVYVGSTGLFSRHTSSSSRLIKHDIAPLTDKELNADNLYNIDVVQFKYNDGVITDKEDTRFGKLLNGFIIEDLEEKYPIMIDKPSDDVKEWSWNIRYIIPPMLKLIQDQKKAIDDLTAKVEAITQEMNKTA